MQTFFPFPDVHQSAKVLDNRRLNKQGVEAYQILRTLLGISTGWQNHPAVKMWRGHEAALLDYALIMRKEWIDRGYNDSLTSKFNVLGRSFNLVAKDAQYPKFVGNNKFHRSHRSNLTRKNPEYYSKFWDEPNDLPYEWEV